MKSDSDIGDNTAIVLVFGGSLLFTGWLLKQAFALAFPAQAPAPTTIALAATERKQASFFESVHLRVEQQTMEVM